MVFADFVTRVSQAAKGQIKGSALLVVDASDYVLLNDQGAELASAQAQADVTMRAPLEVFAKILDGAQNPMMAFMSGKLTVDGSPMRALKVAELLRDAAR